MGRGRRLPVALGTGDASAAAPPSAATGERVNAAPAVGDPEVGGASFVEARGSLGALARAWEELAERIAAPPFLRPGWFEAWWRAFGAGRPTVLTLERGGRLAGVLPLVRGSAGRMRSPTNWHTPVFGPLAEDADALRGLAVAALAERPRHLRLAFLDPAESAVSTFLAAAAEHRHATLVRPLMRSPYVPLDGDWTGYQAGLSRRRRKELGRHRRQLEGEGRVSFDVADGSERLEPLLDEGFKVEASGWKGDQGTAILSSPRTRSFYREVATWAAERGWLRLAFLRVDGRAVAFDLCLEQGGACYVLKGGFDPEWRRCGPGVLLTYESIARAFSIGLASYELLGDADPYKLAWTDAVRERVLLQAFAASPAGRITYAAYAHGRPAAKRMREALSRGRQ